jgi:charged multivesicular body protein 4A/B
MSGWIPDVFGRKDSRQSATEAIISLREQLAVLDKKEEHLERRVEEEHRKAKSLVTAKKTGQPSILSSRPPLTRHLR